MKEIKKVIKYLKEGYGKKCKDYAEGCGTCKAHKTINFLKEELSLIKEFHYNCKKEECATCLTNDRGDDSALGEIDKNYERK